MRIFKTAPVARSTIRAMTTDPRFLIYRQGKLEEVFSEHLLRHGELVDHDGSQKPQDFELLVLDGNTLTPDELARHTADIRAALEGNRPVLVLKPTLAHKLVLAKAKILRHYMQDGSLALLIEPRRDKANKLRVGLAEQLPNATGRLTRATAHQRRDGTVREGPVDEFLIGESPITEAGLSRFIQRVKKVVAAGASGQVLALGDSDSSPSSPPSNIPAGLYDVTPITLYQLYSPTGGTFSGYTTPQGSITLEGLVTIGVYYDNTSYNTAVQWLIIEHSGLYYTSGLQANDTQHIGWSIGALQIAGQSISSSTLVTRQSSPNNVVNQTSYTSSTQFTVGVSAGTDGLSANASYSIGSSQTSTVADWSIVQNAPNNWTFAQASPYNGLSSGFPSGAAGSSGVVGLPAISSGSLAYCTQTVWVQNPASQQNINVSYTYTLGTWFIYEYETGKGWHAHSWHGYPSYNPTYTIDFSAAWPS